MSIGKRIRAARELRGMRLEGLAEKTNIDVNVLGDIEEDCYSLYPKTIVILCDALNVSADYLLGRSQDDRILLPRELTAENGAKAALIGEFFEKREVECSECEGTGDSSCESPDDGNCIFCEGKGRLTEEIPVSWTTTKEIWKTAVAHYHSRNIKTL